jgi:hypothetical protein
MNNFKEITTALLKGRTAFTDHITRIDTPIDKEPLKKGCKRNIFYIKNPLKRRKNGFIYAVIVDCPENESPFEYAKCYEISVADVVFNTAEGLPLPELYPEVKQFIITTCSGSDLLYIRRTLFKEYPSEEELNRFTWQDIIKTLRQTAQTATQSTNAAQTDPEHNPNDKETQKPKKGAKLIEAIRIFKEDTNLNMNQIAKLAGCSRQYLSASKDFQMIYNSQKATGNIPSGYKERDTGEMDAWEDEY